MKTKINLPARIDVVDYRDFPSLLERVKTFIGSSWEKFMRRPGDDGKGDKHLSEMFKNDRYKWD